jgi:hypothetical protein
VLALLLTLLFGAPADVLAARVLSAVDRMCPCAHDPSPRCPGVHARAAHAIATVAVDARDPDDAAARLVGVGAHETCYRTERQANGGPAVTVWQLEVKRSERAALLADPVAAARLALSRAGDLRGYAGCREGCQAARELAAYVSAARWAMGR